MTRSLALAVLLFSGCAGPPTDKSQPTVPPAPTLTVAAIEPVYKATKTIEGATATGVTYTKFGELLQELSTAILLARDKATTALDKALLDRYNEGLETYQVSAFFWEKKINSDSDTWRGEIPVEFPGVKDAASFIPLAEKYGLPVIDRKVQYVGTRYRAISGDSPRVLWGKAETVMEKANQQFLAAQLDAQKKP